MAGPGTPAATAPLPVPEHLCKWPTAAQNGLGRAGSHEDSHAGRKRAPAGDNTTPTLCLEVQTVPAANVHINKNIEQ